MGLIDFSKLKSETRTFAGKPVNVTIGPRFNKMGVPAKVVFSLKSLMEGMWLTLSYLLSPSTVVTKEYPENRLTLKFPERYRATLRLTNDENGFFKCTGCKMCERACPNLSIKVITRKGPVSDKMELDRYIWRQDSCTFCNSCVQVCPFKALNMTHDFENAVYDRRLLIYCLNRYAGPAAGILAAQDEETRKKMMEPRQPYGGNVPMNGYQLPYLKALPGKPADPAQGSNK
ncbi:MAG: 4Fe-4S binding protein [Candidatus Riflebacteria bacterium]|nr:4Fe-4S binding protein [Candidatus Riflebacteria bacterium]